MVIGECHTDLVQSVILVHVPMVFLLHDTPQVAEPTKKVFNNDAVGSNVLVSQAVYVREQSVPGLFLGENGSNHLLDALISLVKDNRPMIWVDFS